MKPNTQRYILKQYLLWANDWVVVDRMVKTDTTWGYLSKRADRTLREMRANGEIDMKKENGRVYYRAKQSKLTEAIEKGTPLTAELKRELKVETQPALFQIHRWSS